MNQNPSSRPSTGPRVALLLGLLALAAGLLLVSASTGQATPLPSPLVGEGLGPALSEVEGVRGPLPTPTPGPFAKEVAEYWVPSVVTPTNQLYVRVLRPQLSRYPGQRFPAVITVPGGIGDGAPGDFRLSEWGYVEVRFNFQGRGAGVPGNWRSDGPQNYNGFYDQDDLGGIITWVAGLDYVDASNIGLISNSFGVADGAGALGRHPDLPVKYYIDFEGPSDNLVICFRYGGGDPNFCHDRLGHYSTDIDPSPENVAWWAEREAVRWIGGYPGHYVRLQAVIDHAQPTGFYSHTLDMNNAAVAGVTRWVRVNDAFMNNRPNVPYPRDDPSGWPEWIPGRLSDHPDLTVDLTRWLSRFVIRDNADTLEWLPNGDFERWDPVSGLPRIFYPGGTVAVGRAAGMSG